MNAIRIILTFLILGIIVMIPMSLVLFLFNKITFTKKGCKGGKGDKYSLGVFGGYTEAVDRSCPGVFNVAIPHGKGASDDDVFFAGKDAAEDPRRR